MVQGCPGRGWLTSVHVGGNTVDDRRKDRYDVAAVGIVQLLHLVDDREAFVRVDNLECLLEKGRVTRVVVVTLIVRSPWNEELGDRRQVILIEREVLCERPFQVLRAV